MASSTPVAVATRSSGAILFAGVLLATAACGFMSSPVRPSNGSWRLSGTINNVAGATIAGARLTVQDGPNKDSHVTTDSSGHYDFASLESGRFKVVIDAPGFVSATPTVDLYTDLEVNFALYTTD